MASPRSSEKPLPPVIQLRGYQQRWIDDGETFKLAVKSARIGYSYATGIEAILDCLEHENTTWTVLSASKAQSVEFVETCQKNIEAMGGVASMFEEPFADELGSTDITVQRIEFSNGSRIMALPANPRTARGYPGNAILDEFAHHGDSFAIWAAVVRQTALGHKLRVLSTPNGEQGKFYDLAKDLGLVDGPPTPNPIVKDDWSAHWINADMAIAEGCPINLQKMRNAFKDDDIFNQELKCVFLKAAGAWLPIDLVAMAEDDNATIDWPGGYVPRGPIYCGIDVGRDHDATFAWFDEMLGDVARTLAIVRLYGTPFPQQRRLLAPLVKLTTRTAIDSTGMGIALYDDLNEDCPGRVMGINFAGTNDGGVRMKTDLAIRIKDRFEKHLDRIPRDPDIRQQLMAVKRESTASGVRFDAPRIEVESPVPGQHKKLTAHADAFWAKALADLAADSGLNLSTDFTASESSQAHAMAGAY